MKVIGLTGSIAMGKSTVSKMIRRQYQLPVWDADLEVHNLYREDKCLIEKIASAFPGVVEDEAVNRRKLMEALLLTPERLSELNDIVHGPLGHRGQDFIKRWRRARFVILDVPLLYEIGWDIWCDKVIVVAAPTFIQAQRLIKRSQLNQKRMQFFIRNQMSSEEKQQLADHVILSGLSKNYTFAQLKQVFSGL